MTTPLDGILSCKGFAYNICNKNAERSTSPGEQPDKMYILLGTVIGVTGSHIKIECLLGNSNVQGSIGQGNILPLPTDAINPTNAPILLTIYGSFHDNSKFSDETRFCNFEGFYTVVGKNTCIDGVYVEYNNNQYNYNVYLHMTSGSFSTNLNYFVYLPNNCTWINNGTAVDQFINGVDPGLWYQYPRL
jgi:hypothetical protein